MKNNLFSAAKLLALLTILDPITLCAQVGNLLCKTQMESLSNGGSSGNDIGLSIHQALKPVQNRFENYVFEERYVYDLGNYFCENNVVAEDFNNDGLKDLLMIITTLVPPSQWSSKLLLLKNEGAWTFSPNLIAHYSDYGYAVAAGDFNHDGWLDIADMAVGKTHIYLNQQNGNFFPAWAGGDGYSCIETEDFNKDGFADLLTGIHESGSGGRANTYRNSNGGGSFSLSWTSVPMGTDNGTIDQIRLGDFNGDNKIDFACTEIYEGLLTVFKGKGAGTDFEKTWQKDFGKRVFSLAKGNINGDETPDLATGVGWGSIYAYTSENISDFSELWVSPSLGEAIFNLELQDFNQDGLDDIFATTFDEGNLLIYENQGGQSFNLAWSDDLDGKGCTGKTALFDNDEYPDLIIGEKNKIRIWTRSGVSNESNQISNIARCVASPNPFYESVRISYSLKEDAQVIIKISEPSGREIEIVKNELEKSGNHEVNISAENLPAGVYYYIIEASSQPGASAGAREFGKLLRIK